MKKYLIVWRKLFGESMQRFFEYRADFFVWAVVSGGWTFFSILFYQVIFMQTNTIAGWSKSEVFLLIGTFQVIDSATWSVFWRNIQAYSQSVFDGSLDALLLQPIDVQFRLSVRYFSFTNITRLSIGIFLIATNFPAHVTLLQFAFYIAFIFLALLIVYCLWFFTATFTFWAEKLENIVEIVPALRNLWSTPADVFTGPLSLIFTIVIPLALITTVPVRILLGKLRIQELVIVSIFALILLLITRKFFTYAIKRYSGIGS